MIAHRICKFGQDHLENTEFTYPNKIKKGGATPILLALLPFDVRSLMQTRPLDQNISFRS